jgi:hypothetical protein
MGTLPSAFQHGEYVDLVISKENESYTGNHITACKIIGVHFFPGKVKYDLETTVGFSDDHSERLVTRLYNIDSAFVFDRNVLLGKKETEIKDAADFTKEKWEKPYLQIVHKMDEHPVSDSGSGESRLVVIDLDGKRKDFITGYYDHTDKKWVLNGDGIDMKHAKWMDILPIA